MRDQKPEFTPEQIAHLKHNINNPLAIAMMRLEVAKRKEEEPDYQTIMDALKRVSDLLEDL